MKKLPSRLRRLDAALADLPGDEEPMLLSELDGYLAGLSLCAEPVPVDQWLPHVWGHANGANYEDAADARMFTTMVVAHRDGILRALDRGSYAGLFDVDERNGDIIWEPWIEGFSLAMRHFAERMPDDASIDDEETKVAWAGLLMLIEIARDESDLPRDMIDELTLAAPSAIPIWITTLYKARPAQADPVAIDAPAPEIAATKIGRNDPCPCGSGKKWKKCCGLN